MQPGASLAEAFAIEFTDGTTDEADQAAILEQAFQQWDMLGWLCAPEHAGKQTAHAGGSQ